MICAYCGKEYEGNVCPDCGGKAQAAENAIVCPYCDSVHTGGPRCANCGADLLSIFAPPPLPEPPVGRYESGTDYIELNTDTLTIYKKLLFEKCTDVVIPYIQIQTVTWQAAHGFSMGFLCVRSEDDGRAPIEKSKNATLDRTTITFAETAVDFHQVYVYLRQWAEHNAVCRQIRYSQTDIPARPSGICQGLHGHIRFAEDAVMFRKMLPDSSLSDAVVPYNEIRDVVYFKSEKADGSYLSVRKWDDEKMHVNTAYSAKYDKTSVSFLPSKDYDFYKAYRYLAYWAEKNRENRK